MTKARSIDTRVPKRQKWIANSLFSLCFAYFYAHVPTTGGSPETIASAKLVFNFDAPGRICEARSRCLVQIRPGADTPSVAKARAIRACANSSRLSMPSWFRSSASNAFMAFTARALPVRGAGCLGCASERLFFPLARAIMVRMSSMQQGLAETDHKTETL